MVFNKYTFEAEIIKTSRCCILIIDVHDQASLKLAFPVGINMVMIYSNTVLIAVAQQ